MVSTLAAQFFIEWMFTRFRWFSNDNASGLVSVPPLTFLGQGLGSPVARYLLTLAVVALLTALAFNIPRSELGRRWMAVRDMDTAAAVIGAVLASYVVDFEGVPVPTTTGFTISLILGGAAAIVALVVALFIPAKRAPEERHPSLRD